MVGWPIGNADADAGADAEEDGDSGESGWQKGEEGDCRRRRSRCSCTKEQARPVVVVAGWAWKALF